MVATVINFNFKAMPAFGWDPERGGGGKRESKRDTSQAGGEERCEPSPSVSLRERREGWEVQEEERALQGWLSILLRQKGRMAAPSPSPAASTGPVRPQHPQPWERAPGMPDPLPWTTALPHPKISLQIPTRSAAPPATIAFPKHPWSLFPWESSSKAAKVPSISPLPPREPPLPPAELQRCC